LLIVIALSCCGIHNNRIIREQISPTGEYNAIYYDRSGGATVGGFIYALSINKVKSNIFPNYRHRDVLRSDTYFNFEWTDDYELTVLATSGRRITFVQKKPPKK